MTGLLNGFAVEALLARTREERVRQDEKWGEQNHVDGTGPLTLPLAYFDPLMFAKDFAVAARDVTNAGLEAGLVTFRDLLIEEIAEAFAETDPVRLATELVQVAAVALQGVEAIERRARAVQS